MAQTPDVHSSVASFLHDLTVSWLLEIGHSGILNLRMFKKRVKGSSDCGDIVISGVRHSIVENGLEWRVLKKSEEELTAEVTIFRRHRWSTPEANELGIKARGEGVPSR